MPETKLIAHGGYSAAFPENTLQSFQEAEKYQPFAIEMDVLYDPSTDQLVCFRPTGLTSKSGTFESQIVTEQLSQQEHLQGLLETLNKLGRDVNFLLDFKQPSEAAFKALLTEPRYDFSRIVIGVRNLEDLALIKKYNNQVKTLALFSDPDEYEEFYHQGGSYFRLWEKDVTPERIKAIQTLGLEVWVTPGQKATENQPRTAGEVSQPRLSWLLSLMVNGILVNDIKSAREVLEGKHEI